MMIWFLANLYSLPDKKKNIKKYTWDLFMAFLEVMLSDGIAEVGDVCGPGRTQIETLCNAGAEIVCERK